MAFRYFHPEKPPPPYGILMGGQGRWAKLQGKPRFFCQQSGVTAVREVTEAAAEIGIKYLTLYAFSTENWSRPSIEVNALMSLLVETVRKELDTLKKNNIRLFAIGDLSQLPDKTRKALSSNNGRKGSENSRQRERNVVIR